jgi:hypothetical protein
MATNFPASLDTLTNPTSSDSLSSPSHSAQHANVNDAIEALQAKVGVDSSAVTTSLDYKVAQLEAISHGKILQVVSTTKTDSFSTTSTSFVDVTGLSASITPTSATSKVLVMLTAYAANNSTGLPVRLNLVRDSTDIAQSTGSSATDQTLAIYTNDGQIGDSTAVNFLDSPATTSATTYKLQLAITGGGTAYVGRYGANDGRRSVSTLTVMEVSA